MRRLACLLLAACPLLAAQDLPVPWRKVEVPAGDGAIGPAARGDQSGAWVTWLQRAEEPAGDLALCLARWAGGAFAPPVRLRTGRDFFANWADFAGACADPRGGLLVGYLARARGGYDLRVLRRGGDGAVADLGTPYGEDGRGGEHGFVSMLPEGDDGVRLFWLDGRHYAREQRMELRTALVRDGKADGESVLDPDVCSCCQTGAALTAAGPLVVYRGRDEGEVRDVQWVRRTGKGWSAPRTLGSDGWVMPGCPVNGPAVAADGERVVVAWFTAAGGKAAVRVAISGDAGTTFAAPLDVDAQSPVGRVDVVATARGALVCWLGSAEPGAALWVQEWTPGGPAGPRACLARLAAGRSTGFPRLARTGDSVLALWVDAEAGRLRGARAALAELPDGR